MEKTFADLARDAFRKAKTLEQLSRASGFLDDPRVMKQSPETRVSIRSAYYAAHDRVMGAARAS